ncbi:MAG TPA: WYL domain-containing protein [Planctomycetota bacterium]|nr:WYL domain-containing protein [Planctomycetota bacterium]
MADQVTKLERLLNLVALFFAAREPVPFSEIVGRVAGYDDDAAPDAHEKRFVRDRADLAALGVETEFVSDGAGGGGYRVAAERTFLRRTVFTEADAAMLSVAARAGGAALGGGPLADALRGALRKLAADLPASAPPSACDEPSAPLGELAGPTDGGALVAVAEAAAAERRVRFKYTRGGAGRPVRRTVSPYGLGRSDGAWYLVGWCHERRAIRCFKLARIVGAPTPAEGRAVPEDAPPEGFRLEDHLPGGGDGPSEEVEATVRVRGGAERAVLRAAGAPRPLRTEDGAAEYAVRVRNVEAFAAEVVARGGAVEVASPAELRRATREYAAALAAAQTRRGAP